ncbi:hypothetical protein CK503_03340 [Aliifodinibius salipaludis]|uniref:Uncharacterized protein n=1 Tax=Fodinibius salipaludis TaxID=2032627 RepID=A0A2A2GEF6_9BACT|nr:hypothetical protein [Aliifodinibius salipaludis]PAU95245.1 hypothetical protein CK503_03340 [Aliifodinibius salipaludis]
MNTIKKRVLVLFTITVITFLQGCGSLETTSGDRSITYEHDFNTMVETVEQAIRSSSLNIGFAQKSDEGNKYTIIFNSQAAVNDQSVQQDQGKVVVERLGKNQTKIIITNPEYHYSVPSHQREKYDRRLKNRIDDILDD